MTDSRTLAEALVRLSHLVQHIFADVSRSHGTTPQQAQLLCVLIGGPVGMTKLSGLLHLKKSSLTGLVDLSESRGLITRTTDPRDRRASNVALTDDGRRLAIDCHNDITSRLQEHIGEPPSDGHTLLATTIEQILTGTPLDDKQLTTR
jgi:DNA-binding MarR family transcriptional regulator